MTTLTLSLREKAGLLRMMDLECGTISSAPAMLDAAADRIDQLTIALRRLAFAARSSGGTAGRDEFLCEECTHAEDLLTGNGR